MTRSELGDLGAEAGATALLLALGLSAVVVLVSSTGPLADVAIPDVVRRFLAGGLFGLSGTAASLSRLGRRSGAHLNPAVTVMFWLEGQLTRGRALGYVLAQLLGASVGACMILAWGPWGAGVEWGATVPEPGLPGWQAMALEAGVTTALILVIQTFAARPRLRHLTPWAMGPLYAVLVALEAPLTGTSSNPARSFGPALMTWTWTDAWVYWAGPLLGAVIGLAIARVLTPARITRPRLVYDRIVDEAELVAAHLEATGRRIGPLRWLQRSG